MEERDRRKRDREVDTLSASEVVGESKSENSNIVWGHAARQVQLGWRVEPKKEADDLFTVRLFLRNTGEKPISTSMPRLEVLEKLGLDIEFRDSAGTELPWKWGSAHKSREELTVSGALSAMLEPGVPFELPPFTVAIGTLDKQDAASTEKAMVMLDLKGYAPPAAKPFVQPLHLRFKLSSIGYARGDEVELVSEAFQFSVAGTP